VQDRAALFRVAAEVYDGYVGRYSGELAQGLIAAAAVEPGLRVLDVGCGPGALTRALAAVVGEGNVSAVDPSESFAAACRERVPAADVRSGVAEDLPFADGTFDATLAQLVLNFLPDPEAGVREMARVTRPGGVVAACVWDYGGGMTLMRTFWEAAAALDPDAVDRAEGRTMPHSREGELAALFEHAGLREAHGGELVAHASYDRFDDLVAPLAGGVGPAGAYYAALDAAGRARLADELQARLDVGDGPFGLSARAWFAVATV
jgi:SAM-dependent methyltransferase